MPYTWEGECGACWYFDEGTPKENDVRFCPKCGKPIVEVKYQEDDDE
jgi:rRNA maturation endonuclease Nob1